MSNKFDFFEESQRDKIRRLVKIEVAQHLAKRGIRFKNYEDKIDWYALIDPKLSIEENVKRVLEELTVVISKEDYEKMRENIWKEVEKSFQNVIKKKEKEIQKLKKQIKLLRKSREEVYEELRKLKEKLRLQNVIKSDIEEVKNVDVEERIKRKIKILMGSENINGLLILGQGGIGKSTAVKKILMKEYPQMRAFFIKNKITARALWNIVKRASKEGENAVIVLDDIMKYDEHLIGMLLALTDTEKVREITYFTKETTEDGEVSKVFFKGKVIVISNQLNIEKNMLSLIEDRCLKEVITYDRNYFIKLAEKLKLPSEITDYIKRKKVILSFRLLLKLEAINKAKLDKKDKIRIMLEQIIHSSYEDYVIIRLLSLYKNKNVCARKFEEETGLSRRTFFRRLAFLKKYGIISNEIEVVPAGKCQGSAKVVSSKCQGSAKVVSSSATSQKQELEAGKTTKNDRFSESEVSKNGKNSISPQDGDNF